MTKKRAFTKKTALKAASIMLAVSLAASPCAVLAAENAADGQAQGQEAQQEQAQENTGAKQAESSGAGTQAPAAAEAASAEELKDNDRTYSSMAEELQNQRSQIADDDILQIRIGYRFDDGSFDEWARGTAFVVGSRYLLTRQSLVNTKTESYLYKKILMEKEDLYKRIGVSLQDEVDAEKHIVFFVEDRKGYVLEYTDTAIKNGMGLVILKEPLDNIPAVVFEDPARIDFATGQLIHLKAAGKMEGRCDVKTLEGSVVENEDKNAAFSFRADDTEASVIGAPLYNEEGNVTGMVSGDGDVKTGFDVNAMRTFLSVNGVKFRGAEKIRADLAALEQESGEEELAEVEQEKKADKTVLENTVAGARSIEDLAAYTEESAGAFASALTEAEQVLAKEDASQEEIDSAAKKLETAQGALTEKGIAEKYIQPLVRIAVLAVIIAALGFLIRIALSLLGLLPMKRRKDGAKENAGIQEKKEKKEKTKKPFFRDRSAEPARKEGGKAAPEEEDGGSRYPDSGSIPDGDQGGEFINDDGIDITHRGAGRGQRVPVGSGPSGLTYLDSSDDPDGKVSVLDDDGSSDTTILGQNAYLIRRDNGKKIRITQEEWDVGGGIKKKGFIIGKEQKKVNYCTGQQNQTVSRTHCMIRFINGRYYIEDLNSSNFTFINGRQIPAETPTLLEDGMTIRLSNVEFEFHET